MVDASFKEGIVGIGIVVDISKGDAPKYSAVVCVCVVVLELILHISRLG